MFKFPFTNFHELNLDWMLEKVKEFSELIPHVEEVINNVEDTKDIAQVYMMSIKNTVHRYSRSLKNTSKVASISPTPMVMIRIMIIGINAWSRYTVILTCSNIMTPASTTRDMINIM